MSLLNNVMQGAEFIFAIGALGKFKDLTQSSYCAAQGLIKT
jgi:hypothetical protein